MNNYKYKFWVPLMNFDSGEEEVRLTDEVLIRRASEDEKKWLLTLRSQLSHLGYGEFLLECIVDSDVPPVEPFPLGSIEKLQGDGRDGIEKALTVFRLYKEGRIGYNFMVLTLEQLEPPKPIGNILILHHYQLWMDSKQKFAQERYKINKNDAEKLSNLFAELNTDGFKQLSSPIRYFNKSYIEPYTPTDSFIDLMIALESLYLRGEHQELRYKLSMRMASVLAKGKDLNEKKKIFKDIKDAYDDRSCILHGGDRPYCRLNYDFLFDIREYARESLKIFIKNPSIRNSLDEAILE